MHAVLLLLVILVAAPLAAYIPLAALAAILISVAIKMGDWDIRKAAQFPRQDTAVLAITFALTVIFDLTIAVEIGLLIAAVFFIKRMAASTSVQQLKPEHAVLYERHSIAGKHVPAGCVAYRVEGALFFGAADTVEQIAQEAPEARVIILQLHRLVLLDTSGLLALSALNPAPGAAKPHAGDLRRGYRSYRHDTQRPPGRRNGAAQYPARPHHRPAAAEEVLTSGVVWG